MFQDGIMVSSRINHPLEAIAEENESPQEETEEIGDHLVEKPALLPKKP
jgi:hypothetical protein